MSDDEEVATVPADELEQVICSLASSSLDSKQRSKRMEVLQQALELVDTEEGVTALVELEEPVYCSSVHATGRVVQVYTKALVTATTNSDTSAIEKLCKHICNILSARGTGELVQSCATALGVGSKLLSAPLFELAKQGNLVAITMGCVINASSNDWLDLFLTNTLLDTIATPAEMQLCLGMTSTLSQSDWDDRVASVIGKRVKAAPETVLETVVELVEGMAMAGKSSSVQIGTQHLQGDTQLMPALTKQLKSTKETLRTASCKILVSMARMDASSRTEIAAGIAEALSTLLQSDFRQGAYEALSQIGESVPKTLSEDVQKEHMDTLLTALTAALTKEISKTATSARDAGVGALVLWMTIAKRSGSSDAKGYKNALSYLGKPLETGNGSDTVQRMGVLFQTTIDDTDMQESLILDMFGGANAAKLGKGLQTMVETANKKSTTVASTEGLVAVHVALLHALATSKYTLQPAFKKALSAGSTTLTKTSFLYSKTLTDALESNSLVRQLLPRTIALYVKLAAKDEKEQSASMFVKSSSAATRAIACCVVNPMTTPAVLASVQTILTYDAKASTALTNGLFQHVNSVANEMEERLESLGASRQARETFSPGEYTPDSVRNLDTGAVRQVAGKLAERPSTATSLTKTWLLMHTMTSKGSGQKPQKQGLSSAVLQLIKDVVVKWPAADQSERIKEMSDFVSTYACNAKVESEGKDAVVISSTMHQAATSLCGSLGSIASSFDPSMDDPEDDDMKPHVVARTLCVDELASSFNAKLQSSLDTIEALTDVEVDLFETNLGTLFGEKLSSDGSGDSSDTKKSVAKGKRGKGASSLEDEEWERQMKKELAAKKKTESAGAVARTLTPAQKQKVVAQDVERRRLTEVVDGNYLRALDSIKALCLSDIEVGNACLPILSENIIRASISKSQAVVRLPQLSAANLDTLTTLANCVYEIDEAFAPKMARSLIVSCKWTGSSSFAVTALPPRFEAAGSVITEMDEYDDCLAGTSFTFLFPIIRAALMGARTPHGCEGALRVLERHTSMLVGDDVDAHVKSLRKEMAATVLELLSHDRSQKFSTPSAYEALVACYGTDAESSSPALTTAELAPLLGEEGALGSRSCRVGAMKALDSVASRHPKLVKNNPLMENRIWVNCFDKDEGIQTAARSSWQTVTGAAGDDLPPPSVMYAIPLLPLLSHDDASISNAAALANATAMGYHPKSVERNIMKLCSTFIDSYPTSDTKPSGPPVMPMALPQKKAPVIAAPIKRKPIATGLPKKKSGGKKDALSIAGISKPKAGGRSKTGTKKRTVDSALLKPKEVRTFDHELLANQFKAADSKEESVEKDTPEKASTRQGMLNAISATTSKSAKVSLDLATLKVLTGFLMSYGLADSNNDVRGSARNALRDVVATFGSSDEAIAFLLPSLEAVLSTGESKTESLGSLSTDKIPRNVAAADRRKEGAVVALGSVALHLKGEENEEKIDATIDMLISTLSTPTESVQSSVADCLVKLMKKGKTQSRLETILKDLLNDCLYGETRDDRRGAAYGISAAVKGSGIASLKKYEVVKRLEEASDSGSQSNKEGSLFAIELLSARLGLLFEPYVIVLLPSLLKSFSDSSDHVRMAAASTADLIMSKLSAHGVKLVMPAVLTAFNDPAWRTKQASIQMLGSMSHLAPKQLASALPKVVPKLTEAFSDTHPKVKASAQEALDELSKVVKNPEISSISPVLLSALTDPSEGTILALEALIETEFLHAIDAPSLALIVPILHRGLRDRVATTKRYGALIAGNICTMINDPKDFLPYLPILLPDLQLAILDPIPDVRSTSAKAVGSLTRSLGEESLPNLRPWLIEKLRDEKVMSAERSGAAQGLTELLVAGGAEVVEDVMKEEILPLRSHPSASTREGVLWILTFLPSSLGQSFTPLIDVSLPALIGGLSDESEPVRDVAMRAGRVLIRSHGKAHVNKILPALEAGLTDEDYRIRVASLTLLGDLLSMIGGTSVVKGDGETQDDIRKAERAQAQIALALGAETRKRVLSGLYLARSDTTTVVRQSAVQVWKTVVSVTARSLRDILPVLVSQIVEALASGHPERTQVAGRCLGDIVNKLGDSVLPEIIPVLRNALYDGDRHTKQGVCVGLSEVIRCSTREQILKFIDIIVKVVQDALCDEDEGVRSMAASCFESLHNVVGSRAFDEIVPSLLVALDYGDDQDESRTRALNGLTGILGIRSRELLPYIIPRLIKSPISTNHARALGGIAEVTSTTLHMHFSAIIPAVILDLSQLGDDKEREEALRDSARAMCKHVDQSGVNWLVSEIASKCGSDKPEIRKESCWMFQIFVEERKDKGDFYELCPIILRELIYRFNDDNVDVLKANQKAFGALSKNVPAEELVTHIEFMRNLIMSMVSDARRRKGGVGDGEFFMPGFNIPKGLEPLLPIYQRGILYGTPTIREVSASGLGELIALTSSKFLAGPLIIKMTGPLLRIVGDRNPSEVKVAILRTLGSILVKGGPALRAFVPQFQTTFVKALADPSRQVRVEAIAALSLLMPLSTRVDPLLKELVSGSLGKSSTDSGSVPAIQTATLDALAVVLKDGGKKAKLPDSIPSALNASKELLKHEDEGVRESAAKVMGAACLLLGPDPTIETIHEVILVEEDDDGSIRHGKACACQRIMSTVGSTLPEDLCAKITKLVVSYTKDDKAREAGVRALGAVAGAAPDSDSRLREVESVFLDIMKNGQERMEMHQSVARGLCICLSLTSVEDKVTFFGKTLLDACLQLAMSGTQRVQYAFNDVLWLALDVSKGDDGLEAYVGLANFDNSKSIKSLHSKVLSRIKTVDVDL